MTEKCHELEDIFVCPVSKQGLTKSRNSFTCDSNGFNYKIVSDVPVFMAGKDTDSLSNFWDLGWQNRYSGDHTFHQQSSDEYKKNVEKILLEAKSKNTPICSANPSKDEVVLNIGCGFDESSQLALLGAECYIGIDYSYTAAKTSLDALRKLNNQGITAQANAESLPIKTSSIDLVYSSGVLHHTPNTEQALQEVFRVLKPGGKGVIGLYSKYSPKFIMARIVGTIRSILSLRKISWFEHTETAWKTESTATPFTSTYSKKELLHLFDKDTCSDLIFRTTGFNWGDVIPLFGKYIAKTKIEIT